MSEVSNVEQQRSMGGELSRFKKIVLENLASIKRFFVERRQKNEWRKVEKQLELSLIFAQCLEASTPKDIAARDKILRSGYLGFRISKGNEQKYIDGMRGKGITGVFLRKEVESIILLIQSDHDKHVQRIKQMYTDYENSLVVFRGKLDEFSSRHSN